MLCDAGLGRYSPQTRASPLPGELMTGCSQRLWCQVVANQLVPRLSNAYEMSHPHFGVMSLPSGHAPSQCQGAQLMTMRKQT